MRRTEAPVRGTHQLRRVQLIRGGLVTGGAEVDQAAQVPGWGVPPSWYAGNQEIQAIRYHDPVWVWDPPTPFQHPPRGGS